MKEPEYSETTRALVDVAKILKDAGWTQAPEPPRPTASKRGLLWVVLLYGWGLIFALIGVALYVWLR